MTSKQPRACLSITVGPGKAPHYQGLQASVQQACLLVSFFSLFCSGKVPLFKSNMGLLKYLLTSLLVT